MKKNKIIRTEVRTAYPLYGYDAIRYDIDIRTFNKVKSIGFWAECG